MIHTGHELFVPATDMLAPLEDVFIIAEGHAGAGSRLTSAPTSASREQAQSAFEDALSACPTHYAARSRLARMLLDAGEADLAVQHCVSGLSMREGSGGGKEGKMDSETEVQLLVTLAEAKYVVFYISNSFF
jgi:hypothetical protein